MATHANESFLHSKWSSCSHFTANNALENCEFDCLYIPFGGNTKILRSYIFYTSFQSYFIIFSFHTKYIH